MQNFKKFWVKKLTPRSHLIGHSCPESFNCKICGQFYQNHYIQSGISIIHFGKDNKKAVFCPKFLDMILENLKEVLMAAQFDRARLMVILQQIKYIHEVVNTELHNVIWLVCRQDKKPKCSLNILARSPNENNFDLRNKCSNKMTK